MLTPNYQVSSSLLNSLKRIFLLAHELNKYRLPDRVFAQLHWSAKVTSTYASTSIEGNPLPLTDVKRLLKTHPARARQSESEVLNYNQAIDQFAGITPGKFTTGTILSIHKVITKDLLPAHHTGTFRREPVIIRDPGSQKIIFLPPDHDDVPGLMEDLVGFVKKNQARLDPIVLAGIFHKQFVIIHPFMDGNGRTARLATQILLAGLGINLFPLLSFENYYNQNVSRYFNMVGAFGNYYELASKIDFTPWLEYFADGILDELLRLEKTIQKQQTPQSRLKPHHLLLLKHVDEHGFITDKEYAQLVDRAKATRTLDFNKLIELGHLVRKGAARNTYYTRPDE